MLLNSLPVEIHFRGCRIDGPRATCGRKLGSGDESASLDYRHMPRSTNERLEPSIRARSTDILAPSRLDVLITSATLMAHV